MFDFAPTANTDEKYLGTALDDDMRGLTAGTGAGLFFISEIADEHITRDQAGRCSSWGAASTSWTRFTEELPVAFAMFTEALRRAGQPLPTNAGKTPDKLLRRRDCAVLNYYLQQLEHEHVSFDTVRCGFETLLAWSASSGPQ